MLLFFRYLFQFVELYVHSFIYSFVRSVSIHVTIKLSVRLSVIRAMTHMIVARQWSSKRSYELSRGVFYVVRAETAC
jgi:hypothetical protein